MTQLDEYWNKFLTKEEASFIRKHAIETYVCAEANSNPNVAAAMNDAYLHKDGYILKHYCLGKSEKVYAGPLTPKAEWKELFESGSVKDMIMQPFLAQRKFATVWEGTPFDDYACGMMLCVDDKLRILTLQLFLAFIVTDNLSPHFLNDLRRNKNFTGLLIGFRDRNRRFDLSSKISRV